MKPTISACIGTRLSSGWSIRKVAGGVWITICDLRALQRKASRAFKPCRLDIAARCGEFSHEIRQRRFGWSCGTTCRSKEDRECYARGCSQPPGHEPSHFHRHGEGKQAAKARRTGQASRTLQDAPEQASS